MTDTITLHGWIKVHTWHESHGAFWQDVYERNYRGEQPYTCMGKYEVLTVSHHPVNQYNVELRTEIHTEAATQSHTLAGFIEAHPNEFTKLADYVSPCCTAGASDFVDNSGYLYRVASAAGHGARARRLDIGEYRGLSMLSDGWSRTYHDAALEAEILD